MPLLPLPLAAYRSAGQWSMTFALAAKAGWPAEQQQRMAAGLVEDLAAMGRAADAAALTLQYLQNVDSAGAPPRWLRARPAPVGRGGSPAFRSTWLSMLRACCGARRPGCCTRSPNPAQCCCWCMARSGGRRCEWPTPMAAPTLSTHWWRHRPPRPLRPHSRVRGRGWLVAAALAGLGAGAWVLLAIISPCSWLAHLHARMLCRTSKHAHMHLPQTSTKTSSAWPSTGSGLRSCASGGRVWRCGAGAGGHGRAGSPPQLLSLSAKPAAPLSPIPHHPAVTPACLPAWAGGAGGCGG